MINEEIILKVFEDSITKCHTLKYGWHEEVKYLKDTHNSRKDFTKMFTPDDLLKVKELLSKEGKLESIEIEKMDNTNFSDDEIKAYQSWIYPDYEMLTEFQRLMDKNQTYSMDFSGTSYEGVFSEHGYFEEWTEEDYADVEEEVTNTINTIAEMFSKVDGLKNNLRIFRGGHFDSNLEVGDTASFDTFVSCSFKENVAKMFTQKSHHNWNGDIKEGFQRYMITILAPKGTKALIGSEKFGGKYYHDLEHELTLNKGQGFEVVAKDDNSNPPTVTIKLI